MNAHRFARLAGAAAVVLIAGCHAAPAPPAAPALDDPLPAAMPAAGRVSAMLAADTPQARRVAVGDAIDGMGIRPTGSTARGITP